MIFSKHSLVTINIRHGFLHSLRDIVIVIVDYGNNAHEAGKRKRATDDNCESLTTGTKNDIGKVFIIYFLQSNVLQKKTQLYCISFPVMHTTVLKIHLSTH